MTRKKTVVPMTKRDNRESALKRDGECTSVRCQDGRFLQPHLAIPVAQGEDDSPDNWVALCARCHEQEHNRIASKWEVSTGKRVNSYDGRKE